MDVKTCTKCKVELPIENFGNRSDGKDKTKKRSACRACETKSKAKPIPVIEDLIYKNDAGDDCIEQWTGFPTLEEIFLISDLSRVRRIMHRKNPTNQIINPSIDSGGYYYVALTVNSVCKNYSLHRSVAIAFIPNPDNLPEVAHIGLYEDGKEGNKADNRAVSLVWSTVVDNRKHSFDKGRNSNKGTKHSQSKLTEEDVLTIRASELSPLELSIKYDVKREQIYKILRRERWDHI